MPTLFEHVGGEEALHRLEQAFYDSVLLDPLLQPLFGAGRATHVDHLTAFTAESFGGPDRFSRELGFAHLISVHRGLKITEEQRQRFVDLYMAALDATEMPSDAAFREAVREHIEFGSQGSNAELSRRERRGAAPVAGCAPLDMVWRRRRTLTRVTEIINHSATSVFSTWRMFRKANRLRDTSHREVGDEGRNRTG